MGRLDSTKSKGRLGGSSSSRGRVASASAGLDTVEGLERLSKLKTGKVPKKSIARSALRGLSRIVNVGTATVAGAVRGTIRDFNPFKGAREGLKENIGFADVFREVAGGKQPESKLGKIALGTGGFIADVLFDPLTYLSFGTSAIVKVGGKAVSKAGLKALNKAGAEVAEATTKRLIKEGVDPTRAAKLAGRQASRQTNELVQRTLSTKKGKITSKEAERFLKEGIEKRTVDTFNSLGPNLLDKGGIKFFGKTLVSSKALAKTPIGKAAKRIGSLEVVQTLRNTLGKLFVADFGKNPKLVDILDKGSRQQRQAVQSIVKTNTQLFKGLSDDQMKEFFERVFAKKVQVVKDTDKLESQILKEINSKFPGREIKSGKGILKAVRGVEAEATKRTTKLMSRLEEVSKGIDKGGKVKDLEDKISAIKLAIKEEKSLLKQNIIGKSVIELTDDELDAAVDFAIGINKNKLTEDIDKLQGVLASLKKKRKSGGKVNKGKVKGIPQNGQLNQVHLLKTLIKKVQNDVADKERLFNKFLGAGKAVKAAQKAEKLVFKDEALQKVSDALFEGVDGAEPVLERFARAAGIPEQEAIKFYVPSVFKDRMKISDFATGQSVGSAKTGFQKKFRGVDNENLIKDPFEAFSRGQVNVVTQRIKTNTAKTVLGQFGVPISKFTADEAAERGLVKFSKKGVDGQIEGWIPKWADESMNELFDPKQNFKLIDDLARVSGFDWATGLFKSYVTALFPSFHARNITSNQFQNMLKIGIDAVNPVLQKQAADLVRATSNKKLLNFDKKAVLARKFKTKDGQVLTYGNIIKQIQKESDILDQGAFSRFEALLDEGAGAIKGARNTARTKFNPLSRQNVAVQGGRDFGQFFEQQAKLVSVLSGLSTGKTMKQSIKQAEEALFDYSKLAPFERSVMRRLIPFYTFSRKNFELQLRTLMTNPGRTAAQLKLIRNVGEGAGEFTQEDIEGLPDFVLDSLGIKAGANKFGQETFFTGLGLPIEEFITRFSGDKGIITNAVSNTLTQMNPLIKFPAEKATGQDFFRDRPIVEIDNAQDLKPFLSMLEALPGGVADDMKDLLEFQEVEVPVFINGRQKGTKKKYTANPFALHFLRNLFTSRVQSTVGFLSSEDESTFNKLLRTFTGVKGWSIDQERQKYFNELERKEELIQYLDRMGIAGKKDIIFEKK